MPGMTKETACAYAKPESELKRSLRLRLEDLCRSKELKVSFRSLLA